MRQPRRAVLVVLLAALVVALPVGAASKGITITKSGFVPKDVSVAPGDSVTWTNSDTVAHQVAFDKGSCNLVVQAGQQGSCTFAQAGTFGYRDPSQRGSFRGTVRVESSASALTLSAAKQIVVFGSPVTLSGALGNQSSGTAITVLSQPDGAGALTPLGSTTTLAGGAYTYPVKPQIATSYQAKWSGGTSPVVNVQVRPRVALVVVNARLGKFTARVSEQKAPVGKTVDLQRRNAYGQWVTLKRVTLKATTSKLVAAVPVTVRLPAGSSRLRLLMRQAQAGPGYLQGWSPIRTVLR